MSTLNRVLVAGGGIGGTALALALRAQGVEVVVLERAASFDDAGSGLVLAPNGTKALAALGGGLLGDVCAAGTVFGAGHRSRFLDSSGRTLSEMSFADTARVWGGPVVGIRRADLQRVLLGHATRAGAQVRTGTAVTGYDHDATTVSANLADGSTVEGDLLVGADGVRSALRRQLLADGPPTYRGYTAVRGIAAAPPADPYGFLAYGRGLILFAAGIGHGRVYWVASIAAAPDTWPGKSPARARTDLLALMRDWDQPLIDMVATSDPAGYVLTDIADRDPVRTWHRDRVVLLGDAAHPMTYTMGQGANTTLEDAVVLAHQVRVPGRPLDAALAAYTAARSSRTAKIAKQSRMMGSIGHAANPVSAWFRDRMMTLMGRFGDPDKQNAEVFGWQPPGPEAQAPSTGARPSSSGARPPSGVRPSGSGVPPFTPDQG